MAPWDQPEPRETHEGPGRQIRAPLVAPGPRGINQGLVGRIGAPQNQPGPHRTNQGLLDRVVNHESGPHGYGAGPRGTNWGLTSRSMAGGTGQVPWEELGSTRRIRALRDASGAFGTRQGPPGRARALRDGCNGGPNGGGGGEGIRAMAIGHHQREINGGQHIFCSSPPPIIANLGRLLGPQAEGALMHPAAGFGTTRDGSGLVGQNTAPQPAGLTRVPRGGSEPCRMNQGPSGTYLGSAL